MKRSELQQLCFDVYYGNTGKYSEQQGSDVIREMFLERLGVDEVPQTKAKFKRFMKKHKNDFYELLEETLTEIVNRISLDSYSEFIDYGYCDLGDKPIFRVKNNKLYDTAVIATGVRTRERQKMHDRRVETSAFRVSIKIYEEGFDFLTGKINWTELCDKCAESFVHKRATIATACMFNAYDEVANPLTHVSTNTAGLETKLKEIIQIVEARSGVTCQIVGTKGALARVPGSGGVYSVDDSKDKREFGYVKMFEGTRCVELPQYFDEETAEFEIPNNTLLIVPAQEKLCTIRDEGDVEVYDSNDTEERKDYQVEFEMARMTHIGVPVFNKFGFIKITD